MSQNENSADLPGTLSSLSNAAAGRPLRGHPKFISILRRMGVE
jgi:hypothetical protein